MNWFEFGEFLLTSYDLDPLYVILAQAPWDKRTLYRFLLAYWVFYAAGPACTIADTSNAKYYYRMMRFGDAAHWPRGHERRHMRGQQFIDTVAGLERFGAPEKIVEYMTCGDDFQTIAKHVQAFRGFGPWISWKVADMTERVLQKPVSFNNAEIGVYKDPVKGAALIGFGDQNYKINLEEVHSVYQRMLRQLKGHKAPPYQDRPINIQELETISCKWKSHVNGHYPLGLDTLEIYHGLDGWGSLADDLRLLLKPWVDNLEGTYGISG